MPASDLTPQIDASNFHLVFLYGDGKATLVSIPVAEYFRGTSEALNTVWQECRAKFSSLLTDEALTAIVVIDGLMVYNTYTAGMFRWLCGIGPNPNGSDPEWMG